MQSQNTLGLTHPLLPFMLQAINLVFFVLDFHVAFL